MKVLVLFTSHHGLHCTSQKERNILLCSKVLYLYLTIFYIISSTIVLYANITVFILYFIPFTILDMYCKNTNTLIFPRCSYFYYCSHYYHYFIIRMSSGVSTSTTAATTIVIIIRMWSGFGGVSGRTKDSKYLMYKRCICWWAGFGSDSQSISIFLLIFFIKTFILGIFNRKGWW